MGAAPAGASHRLGQARPARRVAVLGGGVAGLTAAHELAERGFQVTVYERKALGGKARSMPVPGTGGPGRRPLPGEHGFRFFPGFYHDVPDTMRRIPFAGNPQGVHDNLVAADTARVSVAGGREDLTAPLQLDHVPPGVLTPDTLLRTLVGAFQLAGSIPLPEAAFFARKLLVYFTSSDRRRLGQWENQSWWEFVRAAKMSPMYQHLLAKGLTRITVAAKASVANAHTIGLVGEAFLFTGLGRGNDGAADRVLNGPTNQVWIDPWVAHLRRLGVRFSTGTIESLRLRGGRITAATTRDPAGRGHTIEADWFVLAVPLERAIPLLNRDILAADPALARLRHLRTDWMNGLQFYLREPAPIVHGHVAYMDSPWALTSISQAQFWRGDFAAGYGDGAVRDCLSVDISEWEVPGILYRKAARDCTPGQIAREVWAQIKTSLNDTGHRHLPERILHSWFLDPAITGSGTSKSRNDEPLLVNTAGSWKLRPPAATAIDNLFLAADYVRNNVNLATMEGANQAARAAVNALLHRSGSAATPAAIHTLYRPPELEYLKHIDADRYRRGLPNQFDDIKP